MRHTGAVIVQIGHLVGETFENRIFLHWPAPSVPVPSRHNRARDYTVDLNSIFNALIDAMMARVDGREAGLRRSALEHSFQ
jgi:hypothetical protein